MTGKMWWELIIMNYFQTIVDEQIRTYDPNHERHFIDMYINKMRERDSNPNEKTYFTCNSWIFLPHLHIVAVLNSNCMHFR